MLAGLNHERLVRFAERIVGRQHAEDVVQEAYLHFLSDRVPPFRGQSQRQTWFLGVIKNRAYRWLSQEHRRQAAEQIVSESSVVPAYDEWLDAKTHLAQLKPHYRTALVLYAQHGSHDDVAAILGISANQVKWRLEAARRRLKELMA